MKTAVICHAPVQIGFLTDSGTVRFAWGELPVNMQEFDSALVVFERSCGDDSREEWCKKAETAVAHCQARGIPVAIYSPETEGTGGIPASLAKNCKCVICASNDIAKQYAQVLGADRVWVPKSCFNPREWNPIGCKASEPFRRIVPRKDNPRFMDDVQQTLASGTVAIADYDVELSNRYPVAVIVVDSTEEQTGIARFSPEEIYERRMTAVRTVMSHDTIEDRAVEYRVRMGLPVDGCIRRVLVVAEQMTSHVKEMFARQSYAERVLVSLDELTEAAYAQADAIAFFSDSLEYGEFYLEDMLNAFKYADCDYATQETCCVHGEIRPGHEHEYVSSMPDRDRTVFLRDRFKLADLPPANCGEDLANGYAIGGLGCWQGEHPRSEAEMHPVVSVVVPVHNNGAFLYGRAFPALRRSSLFPKMEIIIVDDGSTDGVTPLIASCLARRYQNVRTFFFQDGGSGTASRPRNKGVELASTDWIVFHDPDNEAVNDGYAKLLDKAIESNADIMIGNTMYIGETRMIFNYYRNWFGNDDSVKVIRGGKDWLKRTSFLPANIQGMVIRKSFLQNLGLSQVVGGAGQDSLLCQQMFFYGGAIAFMPITVQIYFAEREFSIVNSIGPKFYAKYAVTERARVDWLKSAGLMDDYLSLRFVQYTVGWYFKKLSSLDCEKSEAATRALFDLLRLYADSYDWRDPAIDKFLLFCAVGAWRDAWTAAAEEIARIEARRKNRKDKP